MRVEKTNFFLSQFFFSGGGSVHQDRLEDYRSIRGRIEENTKASSPSYLGTVLKVQCSKLPLASLYFIKSRLHRSQRSNLRISESQTPKTPRATNNNNGQQPSAAKKFTTRNEYAKHHGSIEHASCCFSSWQWPSTWNDGHGCLWQRKRDEQSSANGKQPAAADESSTK